MLVFQIRMAEKLKRGENRAVFYCGSVQLRNEFCKLLFRCLNAQVGFLSLKTINFYSGFKFTRFCIYDNIKC